MSVVGLPQLLGNFGSLVLGPWVSASTYVPHGIPGVTVRHAHEADHFCRAHIFGFVVERAVMKRTGDCVAHVDVTPPPELARARPNCDAWVRHVTENWIELLFSGSMGAARLLCGANASLPVLMFHFLQTSRNQRDIRWARSYAAKLTHHQGQADQLFERIKSRTAHRALAKPIVWHATTTLAQALVEHRELHGSHGHWLLAHAFEGHSFDALRARLARRIAGGPTEIRTGLPSHLQWIAR